MSGRMFNRLFSVALGTLLVAAAGVARACSNEYLPSALGTTWAYVVSGPVPGRYRVRVVATSSHGFTEVQTGMNPLTLRWRCGAHGWSLPAVDVAGTLPIATQGYTMKASGIVGYVLPPPAQWRLGTAWSYHFTFTSTAQAPGVSARLIGTVTVANRFVGMRTAHVPAGTFTVLVERSHVTVSGVEHVMGQSIPVHVQSVTMTTYARGVGIISIHSGTSTTRLAKDSRA